MTWIPLFCVNELRQSKNLTICAVKAAEQREGAKCSYTPSNCTQCPDYQKITPNNPPLVSEQHQQFTIHLQNCAEIVKTWPKWKQQLLGGTKFDQLTQNPRENESQPADWTDPNDWTTQDLQAFIKAKETKMTKPQISRENQTTQKPKCTDCNKSPCTCWDDLLPEDELDKLDNPTKKPLFPYLTTDQLPQNPTLSIQQTTLLLTTVIQQCHNLAITACTTAFKTGVDTKANLGNLERHAQIKNQLRQDLRNLYTKTIKKLDDDYGTGKEKRDVFWNEIAKRLNCPLCYMTVYLKETSPNYATFQCSDCKHIFFAKQNGDDVTITKSII